MADDYTVDDQSGGGRDPSAGTIAQLIAALQNSKPAQGTPRIPPNTVNGQPIPQRQFTQGAAQQPPMGPQGALPGAVQGQAPALQQPTAGMQAMPQGGAQNSRSLAMQLWAAMKNAKEVGFFDAQGAGGGRTVDEQLYSRLLAGGMDPTDAAQIVNSMKYNAGNKLKEKLAEENISSKEKIAGENIGSREKVAGENISSREGIVDTQQQGAADREAAAIAGRAEAAKIKAGGAATAEAAAKQVVALYQDIIKDAVGSPSGGLSNKISDLANFFGTPGASTIARGKLQTDVSNLLLAMIRTMRGTGRIMKTEIDQIQKGMPEDTDPTEVKLSKARQGQKIYEDAMRQNGFNPDTGMETWAANGGQSAGSTPASGGATMNFDAQGNLIK